MGEVLFSSKKYNVVFITKSFFAGCFLLAGFSVYGEKFYNYKGAYITDDDNDDDDDAVAATAAIAAKLRHRF